MKRARDPEAESGDASSASAAEPSDATSQDSVSCVQELLRLEIDFAHDRRKPDDHDFQPPQLSPDGRWVLVVLRVGDRHSCIRLYRRAAAGPTVSQPPLSRGAEAAAVAAIEAVALDRLTAANRFHFLTDAKSNNAANVALALVEHDALLRRAAWRLADVAYGDFDNVDWDGMGATLSVRMRRSEATVSIPLDRGWRAGSLDGCLGTASGMVVRSQALFNIRIKCATAKCSDMHMVTDSGANWATRRVFYGWHGGRGRCTVLLLQNRGPSNPRLVPDQPWCAVVQSISGLCWKDDVLSYSHDGRLIQFRPGDYASARAAVSSALARPLPVPALVGVIHAYMDSLLLLGAD